MSMRSPRMGTFSRRSAASCRCATPGAQVPSARSTRCHGTWAPYLAMTIPTARADPIPTYSATSPYDITRPRGIRSTASSTRCANTVISPGTPAGYGANVPSMRILIIGGTSFVGRHMAQTALDHGHDVTLFNRGRTNPDVLPQAERLTGDRNSDLSALDGRTWDATVDVCAYVPRQVRTLLDALGGRGGHYVFVSTISVFPEDTPQHYTEDSPSREPAWDDELTMEKSGELK